MKRIKKDEFIKMVHRKVNEEMQRKVDYWSVYWTVRAVFECIADILREGNLLYIREYFKIYPKLKNKRKTGNFGKLCVIPEHYIPYFKPCKKLKDVCAKLQENERLESVDENSRD